MCQNTKLFPSFCGISLLTSCGDFYWLFNVILSKEGEIKFLHHLPEFHHAFTDCTMPVFSANIRAFNPYTESPKGRTLTLYPIQAYTCCSFQNRGSATQHQLNCFYATSWYTHILPTLSAFGSLQRLPGRQTSSSLLLFPHGLQLIDWLTGGQSYEQEGYDRALWSAVFLRRHCLFWQKAQPLQTTGDPLRGHTGHLACCDFRWIPAGSTQRMLCAMGQQGTTWKGRVHIPPLLPVLLAFTYKTEVQR